ncbi:hypothetical protein [Actinokineospora sp. NPDC004072]
MSDLRWDEVKPFFDPYSMGALPDVYVQDTSAQDWHTVFDLIEARGWRCELHQGDEVLPLSAAPAVLARQRGDDAVALKVWPVPRLLAIFRLMHPSMIDFDIDLRELQGQGGVDVLCAFLTEIGRAVGKPVVMTSEMGCLEHPVLGFDPVSDRVVLMADPQA